MTFLGQIILRTLLFFFLFATGNAQDGVRIVLFGDSITELGVKPNGYVTLMQKYFKKAGSDVKIIGAGVSGNKVTDLLARLDRDVLALKPGIVIIYIGINDVWHFALKNHKGTPKEEFRSGLLALTKRIERAGARVVLCTPTVIGEKKGGANPLDSMLEEYCGIVRSVGEESELPLCDLRKAFLDYETAFNTSNVEKGILTYDGVHLTEEGNKVVADELIRFLEAQ